MNGSLDIVAKKNLRGAPLYGLETPSEYTCVSVCVCVCIQQPEASLPLRQPQIADCGLKDSIVCLICFYLLEGHQAWNKFGGRFG